jgi:crotonobetainyl-CoA:carnitine CoA-transferase CaiB-like acyl-CoA transferase
MLSPYRVLDFTDERGEIAGMVFGDLGADVIRVEPPEGSPARLNGPRLRGGPELERSLQFTAYNRNKRSIALDLGRESDRGTFVQLVASADFVLESAPPSQLAEHGLSFETLCGANPRIVHVQITPFGADGPYAGFAASDLTIAALGGPVALQGVPERPPVRVSVPQVWRHTGVEAVVAALVAHARMRGTGEPQLVDVSAQCAMTWTMLNAMVASAIQGRDFERGGSALQLGNITMRLVFPTRDGHLVTIGSGGAVGKLLPRMIAAGVVPASWADEDWDTYDSRFVQGEPVAISVEQCSEALESFLRRHEKKELFEWGLEQGLTLAPVNTIADLLRFPQFEAREYFSKASLPDGTSALVPGVFAKLSSTPLQLRRPAPSLNQHGDEIRRELSAAVRVRIDEPARKQELPLAGLKVADFSWIGVGPISARYLADHGATVVKVESESRPDGLRAAGPFKDGERGWNRSQFFGDFNTSKQSLALDLKNPAAGDVARRLIAWADVYLESFTPGAIDRLGLGYETARALNPSIVMVSTCLMGQTGPAAQMAGYGYHAGAVGGFYELTGWPDLPPDGPWQAYTDTICPRFVAATLLAALDHRRRTGEGQHIDAGQMEMALHFLAPELLDYQANGELAMRLGNRARDAAPQGVYPCAGEDQWCAIAVETDEQWAALRRALGNPTWAGASDLATTQGRLLHHDEIDARLADWTRERAPHSVMETLQRFGVPAGVVQRSSDLLRDPQLLHRGFHQRFEHGEMGLIPYAGHQFRIRGYESGPRGPAPLLGEHSFQVMKEILGMSDDEITEVVAAEAVS